MLNGPMLITSDVIALLQSANGGFHWSVASIGHISILSSTMLPLGQLSFAGVPIWALAGGSLRKVQFTSIESAGQYFESLFRK